MLAPCCTAPARPYSASRLLAQRFEDIKIDRHLGQRPVRKDHPAVARSGLDADLADSGHVAPDFVVAGHKGVEIFGRAVFLPHLADLAADGNRHGFGLVFTDESREFRAGLVIQPLLLFEGRLGQVDQGRGVNVDVEKTGGDGFEDQVPDCLELRLTILAEFFLGGLVMISLDKDRAADVFP